jgi:hypothetical protein
MKSILESLVKSDPNRVAAYLSPVYGATQKLLQCFKNEGTIKDVIAIAPGYLKKKPSHFFRFIFFIKNGIVFDSLVDLQSFAYSLNNN